jgi:hypothetical protein
MPDMMLIWDVVFNSDGKGMGAADGAMGSG